MYCVIHILKFLSRWTIIKNTKLVTLAENFSKSIKYPSDIPNEDKAVTTTAGLLEQVHVWNVDG